jgi:hypothetical protein
MRPILSLKKKPVPTLADTVTPAPQPAEPVKAPEPVEPAVSVQPAAEPAKPAKVAKPSPKEAQAAKAARAEANRLLGQELSARRRAGTERLKPLLDAYWADQAILHDTVLIDGVECLQPLAVGVHKTLIAWLRAQPQAEGCSNTLLYDLVKALLGPHVAKPHYLAGLLHCPERFHLDGSVARPVAEPHKARARKVLKKAMAATPPLDS